MKKLVLVILLSVIWSISNYGFNIKKLGAENGLSNNNVISIAQDRDGFIWICTKDGLNRFDGSKFQILRHSNSDENSICSNVLNYVYADRFDDVIWIASEKNGLDAYNYITLKFTHYQHNNNDKSSISANSITHISPADNGNLWLATYSGGIDYLNKKTGKFTHYNQSNVKGLVSDYNWYVLEDKGKLYIGHVNNGLSIINLRNRTATNFVHDPANPHSLCYNTVTCIFKDSKANIWIGTLNGLSYFNSNTGSMINIRSNPLFAGSLSDNFVKSIVETKDHRLWIGTEENGINILDMNQLTADFNPDKLVFQHIGEADTEEGLSNRSVQALIQDSYGNFWAGGFIGGANFINTRKENFKRIDYKKNNPKNLTNRIVHSLSIDKDNNLWIANGPGGFFSYNITNQHIYKPNIEFIHPKLVTCVFTDRKNNLWIGTASGKIYIYNLLTKKQKELQTFPRINNVLVYNIFEDSTGNIWISTDGGLGFVGLNTNFIKVYNENNSQLTDKNIRSVSEDNKGSIWVGTASGSLQVFNKQFKQLYNFTDKFNFYGINHIVRDSKNRMIICSQNDLFIYEDLKGKKIKRIGISDGLPENFIISVVEGKNSDELWLSTTNYICLINTKTNKIRSFTTADGISQGDFMKACVAKTTNGTIFFGSQNGITYFNQQYYESVNTDLSVKISSFQINDKKKQFLTDYINFPLTEKIVLNHYQNTFQINYNVLDYSISNKVEFSYQMSGLDESWYYIGKEKQLTFRNLSPGKYTFKIKSRLKDKDWSDKITCMTIIVNPPFWLTWWAKTFYMIVLVLIVLFVTRFYKKRMELENSLVLEKRNHEQEQLLHEERMKFFTNITHELRTPMTLIIGPLEDMISDKSFPKAFSNKLNSIHRVSLRILNLINQILEFRKLETNNRTLKVIKGNVLTLVYQIGMRYKELYQNKNISFEIKLPEVAIDMYYDPEIISIILDNLISNAFKYTLKGNICLELKEVNENNIDYAIISVSDTGIGIEKEELSHIFNRYYQASNRQYNTTGTGIGLSLVKNMVDLHEAEILVESELNVGTVFSIKLLKNNTYPDAIHQETFENNEEIENIQEEDSRNLALIVEDNAEIVDYICECLMDNYDVITADNGKSGYEIACNKTPDIIISDIMMPIMDGIELCRNLKLNVLTSHIPVILLTAKNTLQDKAEGYDAGADSYITKPFSGNLLKSRVKNLLQNRIKLTDVNTPFNNKKLVLLESANQLDKDFIEKVTLYIEQNIENENLNIPFLASQMNMSHSTLYRKIKALTDLTTNEFIRKVRIRVAEQLLLTNKYSVNEVMYRVGINCSSSHFRQSFKDEFGVNPSEYMQKRKDE
jgi:signal transduction histidine kinase/ligand-binding sensor domain-containing protein/DNA-binding response OmpR family regulator